MKKTLQREEVRDYEGEQIYERQMEEAENALKTQDSKTYMLLSELKEYTGMKAHDSYVEGMDSKIKDILSREGSLYTPETKAALIREEAETLAAEFIEKAETEAQYQTEKYYVLGTRLTEAIQAEQLSNDQLEAMKPMEAKSKTDLTFAIKPEEVVKVYEELVERGQQKAKESSYSETVQANIFVKEHYEERNAFRLGVSSPSPRLIKMHLQNIKKKYK